MQSVQAGLLPAQSPAASYMVSGAIKGEGLQSISKNSAQQATPELQLCMGCMLCIRYIIPLAISSLYVLSITYQYRCSLGPELSLR